jgi:DNA polymerase elongation subunit (family B)
MNELIFGKDQTERVVCVEPGEGDKCVLFIQDETGNVIEKEVPLSHWLIYTEQHSPKMAELAGHQPYKWLMEYDNKKRYEQVRKASWEKRMDHFNVKDPKEAFMIKNGVTYYKGLKAKDVAVLSFDLEHTYGIGDHLRRDGKLLLISNTYRSPQGNLVKKLFSYDDYESETQMLTAWCSFVRNVNPSIIVGHNVFGHDFRVLDFAAKKNRASLDLGRDGSKMHFDAKKSFKRKDGSQAYEFHNAHIYGREIVDTFFLAITYDVGRNYPSYKLKEIISHEGLEKNHRTHYDASKILTNYQIPEEWAKIKAYCEDDSDDALSLFDLMIPAFFYWTQSVPRSLQQTINSATGSQMNSLMVRSYLQYDHSIAASSDTLKYEGAISDGVNGLHKNCFKIDCVSLYPSIIRQHRIYDRDKDPLGNFLKIIDYFTEDRIRKKKLAKETGDRFYKDQEQSLKIGINSGYGFLGAPKLNYNSPKNAALVTQYGREILRHAYLWATGKNYVKTGVVEEEGNLSDV